MVDDLTARHLEHVESQEWHATFNAIADAVCLLSADGRIIRLNKSFKKLAGRTEDEIIGFPCWEILHGTSGYIDNCPTLRSLESHQRENIALEFDGKWFDITVDPILDENGKILSFVHIMRDITSSKQHEQRIGKLNRIYRVMNGINQLIVRSPEQKLLFKEVCRIAVEEGGFRMAWIGLVDETRKVLPVAHAGEVGSYLEKINISLCNGPNGHGPTAAAMHSGKHVICNNVVHDAIMLPWREDALRHGFRSLAALPLLVEGMAIGTFNLYAGEPGFFDEEEERLLVRLADDISFALEVARREEQRRHSTELLAENSARLATIMDSINALIYVADLDTFEILFINEYGRKIWGDITGKICWQTLQDGQPGPCAFCSNDKLLNADGTPTGVYVWEFQNTVTGRWYDCRDQAIRWNDGRMVRMEIATDITESKEAARKLSTYTAHLSTLVQTIPDLIWLKDVDGVFLTCNRMFERLLGAKEAEIIGKTDYDFVDREQADFFRMHDRRAMAAGKPSVNEELVTFADDGHKALLETIKTPMYDADGKLIGVLGIARDITEQRSLEEQLRHSQKMESIGTLAGGIAHDFNNILTAIIGYSEITLMKMPENDPLRNYVRQILAGSERAAHLTKDLLLFSRKQTSERKTIDLNDIIRNIETFLKRIIRADITYTVDLQNEVLPMIADRYQLDQVLMNLATNACDAMPSGGTLKVATNQVDLDEAFIKPYGYGKPGQYASITVSDTGLGMDEKTRLRIFEPFFTTKDVGKGTGLGLAVVYGIIKQHDGYVDVCSEPGKGTVFRIFLPLIVVETVDAATTASIKQPTGGAETILFAEDDDMLRTLASSVLEEYGYKVITAVDGADAVCKFTENMDSIDLVIFDLMMPNMKGNEALSEIRKMRPAVKAIYVSGYAADSFNDASDLEKSVPLLIKPLTPTELLLAVRSQLDGTYCSAPIAKGVC